jgi:hypothetical protein
VVEFLRHAVGLCGEHFHLSLLSWFVAGVLLFLLFRLLLLLLIGLTGVWHWLRSRL